MYMITPKLKRLIWVGSSKRDYADFPEAVHDDMGYMLHKVQMGLHPHGAKPLKGYRGILELASDYQGDTYRTLYAVCLGNAVYVLHAFQKKSKVGIKTPKQHLDLARNRFRMARQHHQQDKI